MNQQICASCFVVDLEKKELLMIYNKKLGKWLQPGGHIEKDETPLEAATREVFEETGIKIKPIGVTFQKNVEPFAVESYKTRIGPMIDIQFIGVPKSKKIINKEDNSAQWIPLNEVQTNDKIEEEIKEKFKYILKNYHKKRRKK